MSVTLDDKYTATQGRVYLTGIQALVRLAIMQRLRDEAAGLNTGGFISGYRGSPLGGLDEALWKAQKHLQDSQVRFVPGVNEELAATAVWGSQQVHLLGESAYDGVFGLWYGKGPGVDRSIDVFKHMNHAGTARHGGVLLVAGDDHGAYSSTLPHQSDHVFSASMIPVLYPCDVQEYIELGLHGWAMSRFSGCAVGFTALADTVESSASIDADPFKIQTLIPQHFQMPEGGLNCRLSTDTLGVRLKKQRFGSWMGWTFPVLARARFLRGTALDPFGRTEERQMERALIDEYRQRVELELRTLDDASLDRALAVARVPEKIRGFGPVKERSVRAARMLWNELQPQAGSDLHDPSRARTTAGALSN